MPLTAQEIETYRPDGLAFPSTYRVPETPLTSVNELYKKLLEDSKDKPEFSADFTRGHAAK